MVAVATVSVDVDTNEHVDTNLCYRAMGGGGRIIERLVRKRYSDMLAQ